MNRKTKLKLALMGWAISFSLFSMFGVIEFLTLFTWSFGLMIFYFNVTILLCVVGAMFSLRAIRRITTGHLSIEERINQLERAINDDSGE